MEIRSLIIFSTHITFTCNKTFHHKTTSKILNTKPSPPCPVNWKPLKFPFNELDNKLQNGEKKRVNKPIGFCLLLMMGEIEFQTEPAFGCIRSGLCFVCAYLYHFRWFYVDAIVYFRISACVRDSDLHFRLKK